MLLDPFLTQNLSPLLKDRRVLLGISGSIAAFKACDIVRGLRECGAHVRCVLTDSGSRFVTPLTLETLSGHPVRSSLWESGGQGTHHIDAARWAEVALIAPATANTIARLAHGMADDLLSTELLAFTGPLLVAPAMNPAMLAHPAVQDNLSRLRSRGVQVLESGDGLTACGEQGTGRMLEAVELIERVALTLGGAALAGASVGAAAPRGRKMLITLGPTRSPWDPVRYLTNRSSGLMGAALAWAARAAGYQVSVVAGPCEVALPTDARVVRVQTAAEMLDACSAEFEASDVFVSAAAVLDWEIVGSSGQKLKKQAGAPELKLQASPDVLATLAARKRAGQIVVGFAAETEHVALYGRDKLERKRCDALFANDVSREDVGFEGLRNGGWWITPEGIEELGVNTKAELARQIVARVMELEARHETSAESTRHRASPAPAHAPSPAPELQP